MALDFFAGCVGGCAGVFVGHPLDTVKVRLQTQDPVRPKYSGTFHCLRTIVKTESARGLYKGVTSPVASVSVVNALIFGIHGAIQQNCGFDPTSLAAHAFAGGAAGAAQSVISSPMELAKTRLQLQSEAGTHLGPKYMGPIDCLRKVWLAEGVRGVFRGLGVTLVREVPAFAVYFASFEWMTRGAERVPTWQLLLAGGLAGSASWAVCYPVDVVKTRVQVDGMAGTGERRYRGAVHCFRASLASEGPGFLVRGLNSTLLRAFPTNAATFTAVTWTMRLLQDDTLQFQMHQAQQVQQVQLHEWWGARGEPI